MSWANQVRIRPHDLYIRLYRSTRLQVTCTEFGAAVHTHLQPGSPSRTTRRERTLRLYTGGA